MTLPLDRMTTEEKLQAMELLWDDLCKTPEQVPSPEWHGKLLAERERQVQEGSAAFLDWSDVKQRLRDHPNR